MAADLLAGGVGVGGLQSHTSGWMASGAGFEQTPLRWRRGCFPIGLLLWTLKGGVPAMTAASFQL
jgi:hypothetical protein